MTKEGSDDDGDDVGGSSLSSNFYPLSTWLAAIKLKGRQGEVGVGGERAF